MPNIPVPIVVGVTGGQGVGKSTFAAALLTCLRYATSIETSLISGLGEHLRNVGIPYGNEATAHSIAAIYAAHLDRELRKPTGIVLLDRCCVDALAYVRTLGVTCSAENLLYDRLSKTMAKSLDLVVHLEMNGIFAHSAATHETPALRLAVANQVRNIIDEFGLVSLTLNAADPNGASAAASAVLELHRRRTQD